MKNTSTARTITDLGSIDWYQHPSWYDILHSAGTAAEVDGLERICEQFVRTTPTSATAPMRWIEPACGTARFLKVAASRCTRVIGHDLEPAMIDYAKERFVSAGIPLASVNILRRADMTSFTVKDHCAGKRADFAFCLINSIRHLRTDKQMLDHFDCIASALKPGGVYALGINTTLYGCESPTEDVWVGKRGTVEVTQMANYVPCDAASDKDTGDARLETVINHLVRRTRTKEEHAGNTYQLRCYSMNQWKKLLAKSPFEVQAICDEGGDVLRYAGDAGEPIWNYPGYGIWILSRKEDATLHV